MNAEGMSTEYQTGEITRNILGIDAPSMVVNNQVTDRISSVVLHGFHRDI